MAPTTAAPSAQARETVPPRQGRTRRARSSGGHSRRSLLRFGILLVTVRRMVTSHSRLVRRLIPFLSSVCSSLERIAVVAESFTSTPSIIGSSFTRSSSTTAPPTARRTPANPPGAPNTTTTSQTRTHTRMGVARTRRSLIRIRPNRRVGLSRLIANHLSRPGSAVSLREMSR